MMILSGIKDLEEVMHKIEWSTLLFFAGLFVLMEVSLGQHTRNVSALWKQCLLTAVDVYSFRQTLVFMLCFNFIFVKSYSA